MRKYLIAAIAALTAIAFASVAIAQGPAASMRVSVSPKKAGTKKHPRNMSLKLSLTNNDNTRTASKLAIQLPKTIAVSSKGFKTCSAAKLNDTAGSGCPKGSKVGAGTASALLGVNTPDSQLTLHFKVTAYVQSKKVVNFYLEAQELPSIKVAAPGKLSKTSKGPKLTVTIPKSVQNVGGVWSGLQSLTTKLGARAGKHKLIASTGCKHHKQPVTTTITFADNGVGAPGKLPVHAAAKCS